MIYTPYLWLQLLAAVVPAGFAVYMRRFRDASAARPFSLLMGLTSLWTLFHILNTSTVTLPLRVFWLHLQIIPLVFMAPTILALALEYSGQGQRLARRHWWLLLAIPVITLLIQWTSPYHTLYRYNLSIDLSGPAPVLLSGKGAWYWINLGYMYLLILAACWLLLTAFPPRTFYFWNALIITLAVLLPFLVDLLYTRGITPLPGYNLTLLVFIFTGALQMWSILHLRLFDLVPVGHRIMLEQMQEGMVVVDARQRIVDVNPAAARILGLPQSHLIGQAFVPEMPFPGWRELIHASSTVQPEQLLELEIAPRWYQVSNSLLTGPGDRQLGRLIVWRDITELKHTQAQFTEQQRALAMLEERVRLAQELHDGLGQVVGYVKMRAQVARDLLAQGQAAEVDAYLANLMAVTQEAHTDIREYLLGVKAADASKPAFLGALQQYLEQFSRNYGIRTELNVSPDLNGGELEPTTEVQLLRIIQEVLTNARKYAQAERVQVSLSGQDDQVHIIVQDDGQGFDPGQPAENGPTFGLRFMHERAEELRGSLEVQSAPGQGTRVIIRAPLRR